MAKERIEYIDLAKGICILLVVILHMDDPHFFYKDKDFSDFMFSFRMPLYFMLSGLFLSIRGGYMEFIQKKTNRLIVPFVFFIFITNIWYYVVHHVIMHEEFQYSSPFFFLFSENGYKLPNGPIWFLGSLFSTYIIYAFLHYVFKGNDKFILFVAFFLGIIGFMLGRKHVNLPLYLDSSLTCMPFVCVGIFLRKFIIGRTTTSHLVLFMGAVACLGLTYVLCDGKSMYFKNEFESSIWILYITGIAGSIGVFLICKIIRHVPVISYIGRYSIIVLGVHMPVIKELEPLSWYLFTSIVWQKLFILVSVVTICCVFIYLLKRFVPFFVAQKDFIRFYIK